MVKIQLDIKNENIEEMIREVILKYFENHGILPFIRECVEEQVKKSPYYKDKFLTAIRKLNTRIVNLERKKQKKKK